MFGPDGTPLVVKQPIAAWDDIALRYPAANELWLLPRRAGGTAGRGALDARTDRIHVGSAALADRPSVIVASEPMDDDPYWRLLSSGELIHVDADLTAHCRLAFPNPPAHPLTLADLQPEKARSQTTMLRSTTGTSAAGRRG